jgi:hypothetical protein
MRCTPPVAVLRNVVEHAKLVDPHGRSPLELAPVLKYGVIPNGRTMIVEVDAVIHSVPIVALRNVKDGRYVERENPWLLRFDIDRAKE